MHKLLENPYYFQQGYHENHKGGGGVDTSGLEKATAEATALQKQIYEQTREDVQPWYQAGVGGVDRLSDLLGISGGSVQGREDIYNELLPQYTTGTTAGGDSSLFRTSDGSVLDTEGLFVTTDNQRPINVNRGLWDNMDEAERSNALEQSGISRFSNIAGGDGVNYEALNAAVDARLGDQTTPEGYGSLLEKFTMEDFEADPGYQFRQDEAQKALERSMAAQGVTLGGGGYGEINPQVARALEEQRQGLASQEFTSAFNRDNIEDQNTYNRLMGIAGMGQGSTGQMASAGQNYATNTGNLQTGLATAQLNASQADQGGGMFGSLLGAGIGGFFGGPAGASAGASIGGSIF